MAPSFGPASRWGLDEDHRALQSRRDYQHRLHSFECGGKHLLHSGVRGPQHAFWGPVAAMELGTTENKKLLDAGKALLETDEEMVFGTASEMGQPRPKAQGRGKKAASSSSSGSASAGEADLLAQLKKSWLGSGTSAERKGAETGTHKKSRRFALIEKKKSGQTNSKEKTAEETVLAAAVQSGDPLHGLLALQLAESMRRGRSKKKKKDRSSSSSSASSQRGSSSSSGSSDSVRGEKGHSRAVHNYRKEGKKKFKHPLRHVRRYVKSIEEELGAQDKPFRITDMNRKIHFGKQQNLKRCHYLCSTILEYLLKEEPQKAALQTVLALQAMHQAAIDGSWEVAWLLTHTADPYKQKIFGGDPSSLQHVTSYLRSMNDLAKNTESLKKKGSGKGLEDDQAGKENPGSSKGRGKQKHGKDKDKDKTTSEG